MQKKLENEPDRGLHDIIIGSQYYSLSKYSSFTSTPFIKELVKTQPGKAQGNVSALKFVSVSPYIVHPSLCTPHCSYDPCFGVSFPHISSLITISRKFLVFIFPLQRTWFRYGVYINGISKNGCFFQHILVFQLKKDDSVMCMSFRCRSCPIFTSDDSKSWLLLGHSETIGEMFILFCLLAYLVETNTFQVKVYFKRG